MWTEVCCDSVSAMVDGAILGAGLDLVRVGRVARLLEGHGEAFLRWVLHPDELGESEGRHPSPDRVATMLAAKEAVFKALGHGVASPLDWPQVRFPEGPAAFLLLTGPALDAVLERGVTRILFNWGAVADVRFAVAILWRESHGR